MTTSVATVDLADLATVDDDVRTFGDSLVGTGFVKVAGHGVDPALVDRAYAVAGEVFALDDERKRHWAREEYHGARGYIPFGREQAKDATVIDLKEFWHIGPADGGRFPNVWPDAVPAFEATMTELFTTMELAAQRLLVALATYFDLPPRHLADMTVGADSLLRVLHYPPLRDRMVPGAVRAAAHEDINFITLLPAATAAGLELLDQSGRWVAVDGLDGELVVDSGDMLSRYLNGRVPATTHRVVNPPDDDSDRYSMPFFCQPRRDILLELPAELRAPGEVLRDPPITAGEFHQQRMDAIRRRS